MSVFSFILTSGRKIAVRRGSSPIEMHDMLKMILIYKYYNKYGEEAYQNNYLKKKKSLKIKK
jgi:hypothetical protein